MPSTSADLLPAAIGVLAAYLCGSVPFALLLGRAVGGVDIRTVGSGNVGATNLSRAIGRKWFPICFGLDVAKGALPVVLVPALLGLAGDVGAWTAVSCGVAAVLGHVFPVWLRFRGGKGAATAAGVTVALHPAAAGGTFLIFGAVLLVGRFVSLASVVAAAAFPVLVYFLPGGDRAVLLLGIVLATLVVLRHLGNLRRIVAGTEPKIGDRGRLPGTSVDGDGAAADG